MLRRHFSFCSALSLLLCAAAAVLWERSERQHDPLAATADRVSWHFREARYTARSGGGRVTVYGPPKPSPPASPAVQDSVRRIRNTDLKWIVATSDPDFLSVAWVAIRPDGPTEDLELRFD